MENLKLNREAQTQPQDEPRKKGYHLPEFVEYGKVAKLTQAGQGTAVEINQMLGMMIVG